MAAPPDTPPTPALRYEHADVPVLVVADAAYIGQHEVAHEIGAGFDVHVVSSVVETLERLPTLRRPLVLLPRNLAPESGADVLARCARQAHPFVGLLMIDEPDIAPLTAGPGLPGVHAILPRPLTPAALRLHLQVAATTRRQFEQQLTATAPSDDVRTLVHHLRHEVRGQVQGMIGVTELLQQFEGARMSPEGKAWCDRLMASGSKLSSLVDGLVTWLRLGAEAPEPTWVDVQSLTDDVAYRVMRRRDLGGEITFAGPPLKVYADRRALETSLEALFDNALTYNAAAIKRVSVTTSPAVATRSHIVTVEDNGVGFPADAIPRVLGLFERHNFDDREPPLSGGSGLGLALVARAMKQHQGEVTVGDHSVALRFPDPPS